MIWSQVGTCGITALPLRHTLHFSPWANVSRNLRSETVLQSRAQPQPGSSPCTSAPLAWHSHPSSPSAGALLLDSSWWDANKCSSRTPALHVAAASFPCYEMNHAFILQTVTKKKEKGKAWLWTTFLFPCIQEMKLKPKYCWTWNQLLLYQLPKENISTKGKKKPTYTLSKATSKSVDSFFFFFKFLKSLGSHLFFSRFLSLL